MHDTDCNEPPARVVPDDLPRRPAHAQNGSIIDARAIASRNA
jgi:hypothetical protein